MPSLSAIHMPRSSPTRPVLNPVLNPCIALFQHQRERKRALGSSSRATHSRERPIAARYSIGPRWCRRHGNRSGLVASGADLSRPPPPLGSAASGSKLRDGPCCRLAGSSSRGAAAGCCQAPFSATSHPSCVGGIQFYRPVGQRTNITVRPETVYRIEAARRS